MGGSDGEVGALTGPSDGGGDWLTGLGAWLDGDPAGGGGGGAEAGDSGRVGWRKESIKALLRNESFKGHQLTLEENIHKLLLCRGSA